MNVMYSASPSSRLTDWNVRAKHVATSALASSYVVSVLDDSVRRFLIALMALIRWFIAAVTRLLSVDVSDDAANPRIACIKNSCC